MSRDALVVGINTYKFLQYLKAPALDAEEIAQRLEQDGDFQVTRLPGSIDKSNWIKKSVVSRKASVSQQQLEEALEKLFLPDGEQIPDTALFYFSGHGIRAQRSFKNHDKGYLATSNTNPKNHHSAISLGWLQSLLSQSPVKQQIVWLDCCHSGALIINVEGANPVNSKSRDRCFIASSRDIGSSWTDLNSQYSVLTKVLLDGLEPTRLPSRWINTSSLVDYVHQMIKSEPQTPVCTTHGETINLIKTRQPQTKIHDKKSIKQIEKYSYERDSESLFSGNDYFFSRLKK